MDTSGRITMLILGTLLIAVSGTAGWFGLRDTPKTPGLFAVSQVVDLGTHGQGETIPTELTFRNDHDEPITIVERTASCSCSESTLDRTTLAPGETATLSVKWRLGSRRGASAEELGVVYELHGNWYTANARVHAEVEPDIVVTPWPLRFDGDRAELKTVTLKPGRKATFTVPEVHVTHPAFRAACDPTSNTVAVSFDPKPALGPVDGVRLLISTDSIHEPELSIPILLDRSTLAPMTMPTNPGG